MYVCTTAERQYALEVWRLLDSTAQLIPADQRGEKIINVVHRAREAPPKSLACTLDPFLGGRASQQGAVGNLVAAARNGMPLAVIFDDRCVFGCMLHAMHYVCRFIRVDIAPSWRSNLCIIAYTYACGLTTHACACQLYN